MNSSNQAIGSIHCWLTDEDDTNYAQGSLDSILAILKENGVKLSQAEHLSIYQQISSNQSVKIQRYLIIRLE